MNYRNTHIRELRSQLAYGPEVVRAAQAKRIEDLLPEISQSASYPCEYVSYRITLFRPTHPIDGVIPGADLKADLRQLLLDLSRSLSSQEYGRDPDCLSLQEAASLHNATQATVSSWRRAGLPIRYVLDERGRHRLGCRRQVLEKFLQQRPKQVAAPPSRRRLTKADRADVVQQACALKAKGIATLAAAAREIAERNGVSPRCVERILRSEEAASGSQPLFAPRFKTLDAKQQEAV
nr:hypothetical protein [Candidatus Brocadiia bacterium]